MYTTVKFAKVRPTAKIPTKRAEDAGYDIYADFEEDYLVIEPHETKIIPTGIASACSSEYCFVLKERGSTGTKGIAQRSGLLDCGYRGEWFVPLTNTTDKPLIICKKELPLSTLSRITNPGGTRLFSDVTWQIKPHTIYPYEKAICQALVIPVPEVDVEEVTYEELLAIPSERGTGALGSSGK